MCACHTRVRCRPSGKYLLSMTFVEGRVPVTSFVNGPRRNNRLRRPRGWLSRRSRHTWRSLRIRRSLRSRCATEQPAPRLAQSTPREAEPMPQQPAPAAPKGAEPASAEEQPTPAHPKWARPASVEEPVSDPSPCASASAYAPRMTTCYSGAWPSSPTTDEWLSPSE